MKSCDEETSGYMMKEYEVGGDESKFHRHFRMNIRNLRFVMHYPSEAICETIFMDCFALWKKTHGIK